MKKIFASVLFVGALFSCSSTQKTSWEMYCDKYGVDVNEPTETQENYYLDCYIGSVEEENDLNNL